MANLNVLSIFFFVLTSKVYARAWNEEPKCFSKYDFEEKVLEKQVRTEHKMELYEERMNVMVDGVNKDSDTMRQSIDTCKAELRDFRNEVEEMKQTLATLAHSNAVLKQEAMDRDMSIRKLLNDSIEVAVKDISGKPSSPTVAFMARTVSNTNPGKGERLIFTTVDLNEGDAYDPSTGVFTAPVPGLYIFNVQLSTLPKKYVDVQIMRNTDVIGTFRAFGNAWHLSNTGFAYAHLDVGDTISVHKKVSSSNPIYNGSGSGQLWSCFSGTIVTVTE